MKTKKVYPVGVIEEPAMWCDILDEDGNFICCISSTLDEDNIEEGIKEGVHYFDEFPDVVVGCKDGLVTFEVMKQGLKVLEKDPRNRYAYKLIRKNYVELIE